MDPEPLIRWQRSASLKWQDRAACRDKPTEWWFANNGRKPYSKTNQRALAVCEACPVRAECLDYALEIPPPWHGIFGGHNVAERLAIYKQRHDRRP